MDGGTEVIVDETNYQDHTKPILQGSYDPYTWPDPPGVPTLPYKGLLNAYNGNDYVTFQDIHVKDSNGDGVRYYRCDYGHVRRVRVEVCNMSGIRHVQCHRYTPTGDLGGERLAIIEYCEVSGDNQNYIAHGNQGVAMCSIGGRHAWIHHNIMYEGYGEVIGVYNNTSLQNQGWATVEDNTIYDMRKAGIYVASSGNTIVRRNLIYHTGNSTYYLTYENGRYWGGPGLGICNESGGGHLNYQCNNIYLYNNLVTGCWGGMGFGSQWPVGQDAVSNIKYFNNTCVANQKNVSISSSYARSAIELGFGNEVKNNIFWLYDPSVEGYQFRGYAPATGISFDYNLWS
ncbi:MAG: right-handed parallel beta-helix repeat-containing protein, partial [Sedimentisphaerales bacterium]|nr:right-handed parallel beta-helix repeat-containing protein [Sedimentisphaerales bacterium]